MLNLIESKKYVEKIIGQEPELLFHYGHHTWGRKFPDGNEETWEVHQAAGGFEAWGLYWNKTEDSTSVLWRFIEA